MKVKLTPEGNKVNPYMVPPFETAYKPNPTFKYFWWSWHPNYPYWSKSCWGGDSGQAAWDKLQTVRAKHTLALYHNKLVREGDGQLVVVADLPCQQLEVWQEIARNKKDWRRPTDAQPIKGWDK